MTEVFKHLYQLPRGSRLLIPGRDEAFVLKTLDGMYSVSVGEKSGEILHFSVVQTFKQVGDDWLIVGETS